MDDLTAPKGTTTGKGRLNVPASYHYGVISWMIRCRSGDVRNRLLTEKSKSKTDKIAEYCFAAESDRKNTGITPKEQHKNTKSKNVKNCRFFTSGRLANLSMCEKMT